MRFFILPLALNTLLFSQGENISQRLEHALASSGQSASAIADLKARNFSSLETRLQSANPSNTDEQGELLAIRGVIAFLNGNMQAAVEAFHASGEIRPLRESDRFTLAMALVKLGDHRARQVLTELAQKDPGSAVYHYWLGRLDYDDRRYSDAVVKLRKATELDHSSARAWDALGLAWDMQGQTEPAREAFNKAVTLNRSQPQPSPWPPHNLGFLMLRTGDTDEAEKALVESLHYDNNLARTHYYLARTLEKQGRNQDAIAEYQSAISKDAQASEACYSLGLLYRKLHRDSEADSIFAEYKRRKRSGQVDSLSSR